MEGIESERDGGEAGTACRHECVAERERKRNKKKGGTIKDLMGERVLRSASGSGRQGAERTQHPALGCENEMARIGRPEEKSPKYQRVEEGARMREKRDRVLERRITGREDGSGGRKRGQGGRDGGGREWDEIAQLSASERERVGAKRRPC